MKQSAPPPLRHPVHSHMIDPHPDEGVVLLARRAVVTGGVWALRAARCDTRTQGGQGGPTAHQILW